jgi:phage shock protein A
MKYLTPEIYNEMVDQRNNMRDSVLRWKEKYSDLETKYIELQKEYNDAAAQANMHPLVGEMME